MTAGCLLAVVPTAGHVNTAHALSEVLLGAGVEPHWVTGPSIRSYVERLRPTHPVAFLASHDLVMDRRVPDRRPHLEQLADPDTLGRSVDDELDLLDRHGLAFAVTKDYFAPRLAAAATGRPWVALHTDGIRSFLGRPAVDHDALGAALRGVAARLGVDVDDTALAAPHRSPHLNVVRGLPVAEDPADLAAAADAGLPPSVFGGPLVFDGPDDELAEWDRRFAALPRPLVLASFGTVCYEPEPYRMVLEAAQSAPDLHVVLTCLHLDADALGPVPPNVEVHPYVPIAAAMPHVDLLLHHGGHGTTLNALLAGVPSVVVPLNLRSTQQDHHAHRIEALGLGRVVPSAGWDGAGLARALLDELEQAPRRTAAVSRAELATEQQRLRRELGETLAALAASSG